MRKSIRNGNIEILRFIFSVLIILFHFEESVFNRKLFTACYLGVEFFFIITGVFLGKKLKKENMNHPSQLFSTAAKEGAEYVWNRICAIYPYFFLASLIGFATQLFTGLTNFNGGTVLSFVGNLNLSLLLYLPCLNVIDPMWFLCALFFALLLMYPFIHRFYHAFIYYFSLLFPPFMIGVIIKKFGSLDVFYERFFDFFSTGVLRAVAMISIGLVVNELADRVKELPTNRLNRLVFTACELLLYPALFVYLVFVSRGAFDYLAVVLMAFLLILTLSKKSCLYGRFDGAFTTFLGKASMMVYLCHFFWVKSIRTYSSLLPAIIPKNNVTDVILGFLLTAATSTVVWFGGNLLRFLFRKGKAALFAPPKTAP